MRTAPLAIPVALVFFMGGLTAQTPDTDSLTTLDGIFSEEQAERGEQIFNDVCWECHDTFEFVESGYLYSWDGEPLFELYDYVRTMMPDDNPGSLRDREYAAVFAYLFRLNGLPAGEMRLEGEDGLLRRIVIRLPEVSGGAGGVPQASGGGR